MNFGLNLYSLRSKIKTEEDFLSTAIKLKEMGYSFLQFSGAPFDADMIKRVSEQSEMPVVLTHVPMDRIIEDTDALMEEHSRFGCNRIGLGAMGSKVIIDAGLLKKTVSDLNLAAEKMQKNGFSFYYHNHHSEFFKHGNQTVIDYMIENAPYINFTLDTYWVQYGGASVIEYVEKLKGRIGCVHLKDYLLTEERVPQYGPIGDGVMNFKAIIPKMLESGTEYFIVEQDNAVDFDDPFEQVKRSINYLSKEI